MNFFAEQDQARRHTKWLVILFVVAVVCLILITNVLVAVTFWVADGQMDGYEHASQVIGSGDTQLLSQYFSWQNFGKISLLVCGVLLCVMGFKWLQLSGGGKRVAESLGGSRINPNTNDINEKRVLNVVEEMALASGMPVPAVYLLRGEKGINAFAAGKTPADAVIGVTQGAVEQFDREQLQGVIAHEFSHILNGDMRLNLQMIAMLSGILFIGSVGELLMYSGGRHRSYHSSKRSSDARVVALGLALLLIGWLGSFFGGLIKAAVSRQREFLADASAVQFTRNPKGIADALKLIGGYSGGSRVFSSSASETSHMFIAEALGSWASFDTHPPLSKRIRKIEPSWNGQMISRAMKIDQPKNEASAIHGEKERKRQAAMAAVAGAAYVASKKTPQADAEFTQTAVAEAEQQINGIPHAFKKLAHEPLGAMALVYSLLIDSDDRIAQQQINYIQATGVKGLSLHCLQLKTDIAELDSSLRLPLLELAMPALKLMSADQYKQFKKTLLLIIRADRKFEVFEWSLFQLLRHYLDPEFEKVKSSKPRYKQVKQIESEYAVVLSALVRHGHDDEKERERAFHKGANTAGLYNINLLAETDSGMDDFIKSVNKLANCYPLLKPRLLKGFADCVKQDGEITVVERELLAAIAAVMDCPQPLLEIK